MVGICWNMILSFWDFAYFQGRFVCFRGCHAKQTIVFLGEKGGRGESSRRSWNNPLVKVIVDPAMKPPSGTYLHSCRVKVIDGDTFPSSRYQEQLSCLVDYLGCAYRDEQMRKIWPFSLLNDEQMSNKVGVKHQPVTLW